VEEIEIGEVGVDKVGEGASEKGKESRTTWMRLLALSTALFAVLAAIAALKSGHNANEALLHMNEATLKQAQASDKWSYFQAKGVKSAIRETEVEMLTETKADPKTIDRARTEGEKLKHDQDAIQDKAKELETEERTLEEESRTDLIRHERFAYVVTMLQVAIGLSAVAALIERRSIWIFALLIGTVGAAWFAYGMFVG
jgi:hypothetical protein